jgi:hypothetical protein
MSGEPNNNLGIEPTAAPPEELDEAGIEELRERARVLIRMRCWREALPTLQQITTGLPGFLANGVVWIVRGLLERRRVQPKPIRDAESAA